MEKTVQELAEFLGGTVIGDGSAVISDIPIRNIFLRFMPAPLWLKKKCLPATIPW